MLTCKSCLAHILTGWQIGSFFVVSTDFQNPGTNIVVAALNIFGTQFSGSHWGDLTTASLWLNPGFCRAVIILVLQIKMWVSVKPCVLQQGNLKEVPLPKERNCTIAFKSQQSLSSSCSICSSVLLGNTFISMFCRSLSTSSLPLTVCPITWGFYGFVLQNLQFTRKSIWTKVGTSEASVVTHNRTALLWTHRLHLQPHSGWWMNMLDCSELDVQHRSCDSGVEGYEQRAK